MSQNNVVTPPQASAGPPETEVPLLQAILNALGGTASSSGGTGPSTVIVGGFAIPAFDHIDLAYYGATNNLQTQTFKSNGTTVATLTYAYLAGGVANDDLITAIQKS